ncbi:MAG: vWA domain-containing protein [Flavisolibacter sp.]
MRYIFIFLVVLILVATGFKDLRSYALHSDRSKDTLAPRFKALEHKGRNVMQTDGAVSLITGLDNNLFLVDTAARKAYLYLETRIGNFSSDTNNRVPLNISIVIDRSGSMQGIKMGHAKRAAKNIIDQLHTNDYVSIVIYDNNVDSLQPPILVTDKQSIRKKIDGISPRGSTNVWGGSELGYEFVKRNYREGFVNRVLLISDGIANTGLTDSTIIRLKVRHFKDVEGITISTFGVGYDYNESLMTDMAETGAGNYYFIDAAEKLTGIFEKELAGLLMLAAKDAEVKINLPEGVRLEKGYPLRYTQQGREVSIKMRDLFANDSKGMLLCFDLDKNHNAEKEFTTTLEYFDTRSKTKKLLVNRNLLNAAKNTGEYQKWFNQYVREQQVLYTSNELLEKAMVLVDRGEMVAARKTLQNSIQYLSYFPEYIKASSELRRMDSIIMEYSERMAPVQVMHADTLKKFQKVNKAASYRLRQKKQ